MSNFNASIPHSHLVRPGEMSALTSRREPGSINHLWRPVRHNANRSDNLTGSLGQAIRRMNHVSSQNKYVPSYYHPFKIYQFPAELRVFNNDDDWQRFKVRFGRWGAGNVAFLGNACDVWGTDNIPQETDNFLYQDPGTPPVQIPPTDATQISPNTGTWNEIVVPLDDALYYFWLTLANDDTTSDARASIVLAFGSSPTGCTDMYGGNTFDDPWTIFPHDDPYHVLIGTVIGSTATGNYTIWQAQCDHIPVNNFTKGIAVDQPFTMNMRFCGTYNALFYYWVGDVVLKIETTSGKQWLVQYVVSDGNSILTGPLIGVDPTGSGQWTMLSKSPIDADYTTGAYDASKYYLRTA